MFYLSGIGSHISTQRDVLIAVRVSRRDDYFIGEIANPFGLYSEVAFCELALYRRKLVGLTAVPKPRLSGQGFMKARRSSKGATVRPGRAI